MGVYISLHASNKIDPEQWEKAYEESLILVDKLEFIELQEFEKFDSKYIAAVKSAEHESSCGLGWKTVGDGIYMAMAEDFSLPRKIGSPKKDEKYCDPLMYICAQQGVVDFENPYVQGLRLFWHSKTQGEPYHIGLLAIGCLLDDRLNGEVLCGDDITYGQCKQAVEIANKILKKKIGMPLRCRIDDLYARIRKLPIEKENKLAAFSATYLGVKDEQYYKFVEEHFSDEEQYLFFKKKMFDYRLESFGFSDCLKEVLSYNVSIARVCSIFMEMPPEKKMLENGGNPFEEFIKEILDTNIYLHEKDMRNCLSVNEESAETMSVEKLFAGFLFRSAWNRSVARYIPLKKLKSQLVEAFGNKCDVGKIIDEYLQKKSEKQKNGNACAQLNDLHDMVDKQLAVEQKNYDINDTDLLGFYVKGASVAPRILENLKDGMKFFRGILEEKMFTELSQADYREKCRFLVTQNRSLWLKNSVWLRIFDDVKDHPECFKRYYPMVRVELNSRPIRNFVRAYMGNDAFYELCQGL